MTTARPWSTDQAVGSLSGSQDPRALRGFFICSSATLGAGGCLGIAHDVGHPAHPRCRARPDILPGRSIPEMSGVPLGRIYTARHEADDMSSKEGFAWKPLALALALSAAALSAGPTPAQAESAALKRIKDRRGDQSRLSRQLGAVLDSWHRRQARPVIPSICARALANAIMSELKMKSLKVERFPHLADAPEAVAKGKVDMECGMTTVTMGRQKEVDFSNLISSWTGATCSCAKTRPYAARPISPDARSPCRWHDHGAGAAPGAQAAARGRRGGRREDTG